MSGCLSRNAVVIEPSENGFLGPAVALPGTTAIRRVGADAASR